MSFQIARATLGPYDTNAYLLIDGDTKHCALVDTPPGAAETLRPEIERRGLTLDALLLTHGHWDHIADAHAFAGDGVKIYAHRADIACYETPERFAPWYMASVPGLTEEDFQPVQVTDWVDEGDTFTLLGETFEVRHVPGHCPGNVLFYCPQRELAFPGDAIFAGSVGRSDLPGGDWKQLETSIRGRIYTLPAPTVLYPGHGEPTSVRDEKESNPYVRE
ncbi:MAG: MBL fold metallo-hydrolase [Puniceicoccales bacterium]|jgi:glyoxylase-like metal-dependent hydrolase (beta-lactamase superfamily II)|nr:MBL fold metallo-hydrolase [Puniceicoccales bacterium]